MDELYEALRQALEAGHSVWVAGNGGSYADAQHMMGELRKGFRKKRAVTPHFRDALAAAGDEGAALAGRLQLALPVFALEAGVLGTAICNDMGGDLIYAQQLMGAARPGDLFVAISTSGDAENLVLAAITAKALGARVAALTGRGGGRLRPLADVWLGVDEEETYKVQEAHTRLYHALCLRLEEYFFPE